MHGNNILGTAIRNSHYQVNVLMVDHHDKLTFTGIPCTLLHLGILLDMEDNIPLKNIYTRSCVIHCLQIFVYSKHFI